MRRQLRSSLYRNRDTMRIVYALLPALSLAWYCDVTIDDIRFDLTQLDKEVNVTSQHKTPPTVTQTTYRLNPCRQLKVDKSVSEQDQCPSGTQVCRTVEILKDDKATVVEVTPYAAVTPGQKEEADVQRLKAQGDGHKEGLSVKIFGGHDGDGKALSSLMTFICDSSVDVGEPELISSDGNLVRFDWRTKFACEKASQGRKSGSRSSWGFFTW